MNPFSHTFATKTDGTLWAWGSQGGDGVLGLNEQNVKRSSPTQIPGTQWNSLGTKYQGGACTKTDGTLWVWGRNQNGSLGQNSGANIYYSSPVQVPGTQWDKIVQDGEQANVACTKTDGTLWMMGDDSRGCFGLNSVLTYGYSSPTQVPGTQWNLDYVSLSYTGCAGLKTDGTMWQWGANNYGWFGLNDIVARSSPVQIPGTQWSKLFKGRREAFGIKTDGTLWMIGGYNSNGQLGLNDVIARSSPVQIPGTQWSDMRSGTYGNLAKKTDGTLWAWGRSGATMQNDDVRRSSPVQIPGTTWDLSVTGEGGTSYAVNKPQ
jgi:alpha-tubulin suppressor-like RCC1 family protein